MRGFAAVEHLDRMALRCALKSIASTPSLSRAPHERLLCGEYNGDADVVVSDAGNTYEPILRSPSGKIELNVKEGALNGVDPSHELQRAQALLQREPAPARPGSARTLFNTFSGSATLDKGVLRNDDSSFETDSLEAHGKGTLDLGTQAIDDRLGSIYKGLAGTGKETRDTEARIRQEVNDELPGKKDGAEATGVTNPRICPAVEGSGPDAVPAARAGRNAATVFLSP